MSSELFRVTVDEPNYSKVLGEPLEEHQVHSIQEYVSTDGEARIWAINQSFPARHEYENFMRPGDDLLFYKVKRGYASDEGNYVGIARIDEKVQTDEQTALDLFQTPTAQLMFTVTEFTQLCLPVEYLEPILGYKKHPQRTQRVKPNRYRSVSGVFDELREAA